MLARPRARFDSRRPLRVASAWLLVCAYTALIWWLSAQNIDFKLIERVPMKDKGVHFFEYGVLGALMAHAVNSSWPRQRLRYLAALWLSCGLGLIDELHQLYVPGRFGDMRDLAADVLGAGAATLLFAVFAGWSRYARARRTSGG